jgi:hypothetical protein
MWKTTSTALEYLRQRQESADRAAIERDCRNVAPAIRLIHACAPLSLGDRLLVLQSAWIMLAAHVRGEALATPGGFPAEPDRQLEWLEREAHLVRAEVPDLELQRLIQEDDAGGVLAHLRTLRDDFDRRLALVTTTPD